MSFHYTHVRGAPVVGVNTMCLPFGLEARAAAASGSLANDSTIPSMVKTRALPRKARFNCNSFCVRTGVVLGVELFSSSRSSRPLCSLFVEADVGVLQDWRMDFMSLVRPTFRSLAGWFTWFSFFRKNMFDGDPLLRSPLEEGVFGLVAAMAPAIRCR